jgi:two-component system response regulator NreC
VNNETISSKEVPIKADGGARGAAVRVKGAAVIRVALVDRHELIRIGLKVAMEQDPQIKVVLDTGDPAVVLSSSEDESFDLILIDVSEEIYSAHLTQRTVLMSATFDLECLLQTLCGNVAGYLIKDTSPRELIAAIHAIACGGIYIHSALMDRLPRQLLRHYVPQEPTAPWAPRLSEREREILSLLVKGYTNREISEELYLSSKTIESYRAKIYSKLGVRTRAGLFSCAIDHGLVAL